MCGYGIASYIGFSPKRVPNAEFILDLVFLIIECAIWGLYRAMYEHYRDLNRAPLHCLILLFIASVISNITDSYRIIFDEDSIFRSKFLTLVFKNGNLLVYICAIQFLLADIVIRIAQWSITLRTFQALRKQLWDKNNSLGI
jgi:hypothetical protein